MVHVYLLPTFRPSTCGRSLLCHASSELGQGDNGNPTCFATYVEIAFLNEADLHFLPWMDGWMNILIYGNGELDNGEIDRWTQARTSCNATTCLLSLYKHTSTVFLSSDLIMLSPAAIISLSRAIAKVLAQSRRWRQLSCMSREQLRGRKLLRVSTAALLGRQAVRGVQRGGKTSWRICMRPSSQNCHHMSLRLQQQRHAGRVACSSNAPCSMAVYDDHSSNSSLELGEIVRSNTVLGYCLI